MLLSLFMLASLNGFGGHVHWKTHGHGFEHDHGHAQVIAAVDAEHAKAHADGGVDEESSKIGKRSVPDLPQMAPAPAPVVVVFDDQAPTLLPPLADQRVTGPPRYLTPPSQAPPQVFLTV